MTTPGRTATPVDRQPDPVGWLPPARDRRRALSEAGAVVLALSTCAGAWWAGPIPLSIGVGVMVGALALSRPSLLVVAAFVLAAGLGHRSLAGLDPPPRSPFTGVVTLVSDPRVQRWGASVDDLPVDLVDVVVNVDGRSNQVAVALRPECPFAPELLRTGVV